MNTPSISASKTRPSAPARGGTSQALALALAWTAVGLPLAWGVAETLRKALALFQ
jgi:hypothetical protein